MFVAMEKKLFLCRTNPKDNYMETTNTIRIPNPSKELVAFIEKAQQEKRERMRIICEKYRKQFYR